MTKPYFDGIDVGDWIWNISWGRCRVVTLSELFFTFALNSGIEYNRDYDGRPHTHYDTRFNPQVGLQDTFWDEVRIISPQRPRNCKGE